MNLSKLIDQIDSIEKNEPSIKRYINESVYDTPEMVKHWRKLDEGFFKGYSQYLSEVALNPEQIQSIFKQASGGAAGGEAAKDPGKLAAIVDKVLPSSQAASLEKSLPEPNAGPVQGFEQKAGAAVQSLQGVDSGTKQSLMQLVKAGVSKPETQQLILAAVGAGLGSLISKVGPILSMIPGGGPVASAITGAIVAGGVAVIAAKLRGDDWKTAFKGAIKPALMGGASAVVGNLVTSGISAMMAGGQQQQPAGGDGSYSGQGKTGEVDPDAPAGGGMKNPDGSPMTNAQVSAAMDRVAPIAGSDADPNKYYNSLSPEQQRATDDAIVAQARGNGSPTAANPADAGKTGADFAGTRDANGVAPYATGSAEWAADRAAGKIPDLPVDSGDSGTTSNQGRLKMNQWRQDVGSPNYVNNPANNGQSELTPAQSDRMTAMQMQAGSLGAGLPNTSGATAGGVPIGSTPDGINRLTGKPISSGPSWSEMTPDQQAATVARQQAERDALRGGRSYADHLNDLAAQGIRVRGLKESFAESNYVDKQATLRKWLVQESKGQKVHGLVLKSTVKEGIMDSLKGMFGGKGKEAAPAAGGITADALNKAWTAAGSPTDSEEVAKVLQGAGVPAETVTKIFTDLKLPPPGSAPEQPAQDANKDGKPDTPAPAQDANKDGQPDAPAQDANKDGKPDTPAPAGQKVNISALLDRINKLADADKQKVIAALQG